ncbi:chloride channel protein [Flavobacterium limnosediminis JC2902]|uniref:Chloride channel protein n=1 Tax=Flavobacterium limnosediminis JC2902 TaxID=1341181 RepID=V6SVA1_9FLAO|nr:chloride channel protein [Flavobacterium limnosediminis]ESU28350.1 chloride channel protein [Flavobacterium limnosediminis JC2902]
MPNKKVSPVILLLRKQLKRLEAFLFLLKSVLSNRQFLYLSCVLVGISSALAVIVLKTFAHSVFRFANYIDGILHLPYSNSILPIIGILLTAFVIKKFLDGSIEKGTSQIMIAVANKSGIMPKKQMYAQIITSSLTVGMGGSAGLESPITITGAAFGSNYAQKYRLNYKDRTLLLACGVAAGIAAAFNAPIAGVLFAIEVILADMSVTAFIPIMISAATGALVSTVVLKEDILLSFRSQLTFDYHNIPYYIVLGILAGLVSVYHARNFRKVEHFFSKFKSATYKKALFGASILAVLIFFFPTLFGEGYESIKVLSSANPGVLLENTILDGHKSNQWILLGFIGLTLMIKSIATGLTLGSGGNGGNFAPALFVGSYLGFFVAKFFQLTGIDKDLPISNFSVVGMAGVLSGLFHSPLTAIFLIAEITGGYGLMVPLLIVSSISFIISKNMEGHSMDIKNLANTGTVFTSDKDKNILSSIDLSKLIQTDFVSITSSSKLDDVVKSLSETKQSVFPVVNEQDSFVGVIHFDSIRPIIFNAFQVKYTLLSDIIERPAATVNYDEIMETVMEKFESSNASQLFVLKDNKCLGYVTKVAILDAYREKLKLFRIE